MAYIFKNAQGNVIATSVAENFGSGWVFVEDNAKEYLEFLENSTTCVRARWGRSINFPR